MSSDVVGAHYPTNNPLDSAFALNRNATVGSQPLYTNIPYIGRADTDETAALVTTDMTLVPVPVPPEAGITFTKCTVEIGATASSTLTHFWCQLYNGVLTTAKPIGTQSTDTGAAVIAASGPYSFTLPAYTIQPADCPYGYIYVGIGATASTVPSMGGASIAAAIQGFAWFTNGPLFVAGHISAAGATAPTSVTLASVTAQAAVPFVALS